MRRSLFQYDLDLDVVQRLGIIGHGLPQGLTFDKNKKKLFWSDTIFKRFAEGCIDGLKVTCGNTIKRFGRHLHYVKEYLRHLAMVYQWGFSVCVCGGGGYE